MNNSKHVYGVINSAGIFTDCSRTERGAKIVATRGGYRRIGRRHVDHYYVTAIAEKIGGRWRDCSELDPTVYGYGHDETRPTCPTCDRPVPQITDTPDQIWRGVCSNGHAHLFQLDE